ncbi:MAG: hypothetical protein QXD66_00385 [Candidatus Nezhaarchaeales archaeon]
MVAEGVDKKEVETTEPEDFVEYLWRDFYEVKRKLTAIVVTSIFES